MRRPAFLVAILALLAPLLLATATPAAAAPPGYDTVTTCPGGDPVITFDMKSTDGSTQGELRIWSSSVNQGTWCAKVYDLMSGAHYMNVTIQRADWTTVHNDPKVWEVYAGGVLVKGVQNVQGRRICGYIRGVLQANGRNYNAGYDFPCPPTP